ncbi:hypothetical protein AAF712_006861 [Marasmius tenuissimus]|uniref:Uncharacterized protein n=1 Tax=Marasmius tenuissimus TaxID=585030 RepID=A0ABR2ZZ09_9AGAR
MQFPKASSLPSYLASFPHLQHLYLDIKTDDLQDAGPLHYTSYTLKSATFRSLPSLGIFTFPNLKSLEIIPGWSAPSIWAEDSRTCLAIALLQLLPMLTTLEIVEEQQVLESGGRPITGTFLKHFVVPHQPEVLHTRKILFPRLTDPVFRVAQKNEMVEQDFYDAISSRWIPDPALAREIGVACLRSARITVMWCLSPDPAVFGLSPLECFRDAGLRLEAAHKIVLW